VRCWARISGPRPWSTLLGAGLRTPPLERPKVSNSSPPIEDWQATTKLASRVVSLRVARLGVEPTDIGLRAPPEGWSRSLCQFAYRAIWAHRVASRRFAARCIHLRARESNHGLRAYETRSSTGPPACPRPRYRTGQAGFMRAGRAPAAPGDRIVVSC